MLVSSMSALSGSFDKRADILVVATPVSTKDTAEQIALPGIGPALAVVGLSSEFEVSFVLKGDHGLKKLVVHHYRLANPDQKMNNAPFLASFESKKIHALFTLLAARA